MTDNQIIVGLTAIVVLGVGAQWIGRRLGFPSLLLLLPAGLLAGGGLGLVQSQELLGDTLFPLVTLLVALLLFHSGLTLRLTDLPREARGPVFRLVGIGGTVTFLGASLAISAILDIPRGLAFLVGAIVVVSGPTVVGPLLRVVRPRKPAGEILNWESTFLDPIGATLGVVVLNLVLASDRGGMHPLLQLSARLALGVAVGLVAAALLVFVMSRFLVTDNMEAAVAVLFAVAAFGIAEVMLSEAGLFATVTLGFVAANQRLVHTGRIEGFGETIEVLTIGTLFILLGALVDVHALGQYAWQTLAIVVVLVVIVRPLSAAVALTGTSLPSRDRAFVAGLDPRGIVAAATAAQFAGTLADAGFDSGFILPVVFGVILGTGIGYGLGAAPLARRLGVALPPARGVGIVGGEPWLVDLGRCLQDSGARVLLITSRPPEGRAPASVDLPRISLSDSEYELADALQDSDVAQVLVSSPPGLILTLAMAEFVERLGRRQVLRLPEGSSGGLDSRLATGASAQPFAPGITRQEIERRVAAGATVRVLDDADRTDALRLASVAADGTVDLRVADRAPRPGDTVIGLVGGPAWPGRC